MTDLRQQIVAAARYFQAHRHQFIYTEGPQRMNFERLHGTSWPITTDCSGFVTLCYLAAGAPDPSGLGYNGQGYTGTLLGNHANQHIPLNQVQPGDLVVYGGGTGEHTAIVVEVHGTDILTVSNGDANGPIWCWVNKPVNPPANEVTITTFDGRTPQTFLRCQTSQSRPAWNLA